MKPQTINKTLGAGHTLTTLAALHASLARIRRYGLIIDACLLAMIIIVAGSYMALAAALLEAAPVEDHIPDVRKMVPVALEAAP